MSKEQFLKKEQTQTENLTNVERALIGPPRSKRRAIYSAIKKLRKEN